VVPLIALANLPADLKMEAVRPEQVPAELRPLGDHFMKLGFHPVEPPFRVEMAPAAYVIGFVHETEPVYGTAFRTTTVPAKTSYDFVSILEGDRGGLTTNADPSGAALPAESGGFRQVLRGQDPERLFRAHLDGLAYLRSQGFSARPVSAETFQRDLKAAVRRQRELFLATPLRSSMLTLWRAATKQVPFSGSLRTQKVASEQLRTLLSGGTQRAF
jgi:hypothetical protein